MDAKHRAMFRPWAHAKSGRGNVHPRFRHVHRGSKPANVYRRAGVAVDGTSPPDFPNGLTIEDFASGLSDEYIVICRFSSGRRGVGRGAKPGTSERPF
jgi:hypothetical protein